MSATYHVVISVMLICSFLPVFAGQQEEFKRFKSEELERYLQQEQKCDLGEATRQLVAIALSGGCMRSTINGLGGLLQKRLACLDGYSDEKNIVHGLLSCSVRLAQCDSVMSLKEKFTYAPDKPKGTIVHWASYMGNNELIQCIMKISPENARQVTDACGNSPLHLAAMAKRVTTVELLMRLGFKKDARNNDRQLPIDFVDSKHNDMNRRMVELLSATTTSDEMKLVKRVGSRGHEVQRTHAKPPVLCNNSNKKRGNPQSGCLPSFLQCMSVDVE